MFTIINNVINNALLTRHANVIAFNARSQEEIADFDFDIFTFEGLPGSIKLDQSHIRLLDIDCILNLRPFENNLGNIIQFAGNSRIEVYNYILEINETKPEVLMAKSRQLEGFRYNYFKNESDFNKIYIPGSQVITEKEFSRIINV